MDRAQKALVKYINAITDLAEAVKTNVQHGGKITDDTVLKLNAFTIAMNEFAYIEEELKEIDRNKFN